MENVKSIPLGTANRQRTRFSLTAESLYVNMRTVMKVYSKDEVIEMIRKRIGTRTQREFALEMGVSQQYLNDVLQGRRAPGPSILASLGLEKAFVQSEQTA